jgi:hypothetical protein
MLFSLQRELCVQTGITHSLFCYFTSTKEQDLIVVKGNHLFIYKIFKTLECHLFLYQHFRLEGNVTSIKALQLSTNCLLLSFQDAKLSIIEYSQALKQIITVSMHNYEKEEFKRDLILKGSPVVCVDHQNRCAVLSFYFNHFAILPFRQEGNVEASNRLNSF